MYYSKLQAASETNCKQAECYCQVDVLSSVKPTILVLKLTAWILEAQN